MWHALYLLVFIFSLIIMCSGSFGFGFLLLMISSIAYAVYYIKSEIEVENKRFNQMTPEEKNRYNADNTIDYTILVSEDSKKSLGSSIVRGAVGGALLGPVGLVGGAVTGKNKTKTTFTIVYKSGRKEVQTVENNSNEFETYARYLK